MYATRYAFVMALLAALCLPSSANSQDDSTSAQMEGYPVEELAPDSCPRVLIDADLVATIDFTNESETLDGWQARDGVTLRRGEKSLVIDSQVSDPYIFSPMLSTLLQRAGKPTSALHAGQVLVKLRASHEKRGSGQIFFAQESAPGYNEGHSTHFDLVQDQEFHDYYVPLELDSALLRIRFDIGDSQGLAEIQRVDIYQCNYAPVKFTRSTISEGKLSYHLLSNADSLVVDMKNYGVDPRRSYPTATINVRGDTEYDLYYPQRLPFEEINVVATVRDGGYQTSRRFFAFNEALADRALLADSQCLTLKDGQTSINFYDGLGADVIVNNQRLAVIYPLIYEEGDGAEILQKQQDFSQLEQYVNDSEGSNSGRLTPVFRSISEDGREIEFYLCRINIDAARQSLNDYASEAVKVDSSNPIARSCFVSAGTQEPDPSTICGHLTFRLDGNLLSYEFDAPCKVHAPVVRVLGELEQAVLPGVEFLDKGEHSSSTADIETPEHVRYAPAISWITQPNATIRTDRASVSLLYDNPKAQPIFACPDFLDCDAHTSRMNICDAHGSGVVRFVPSEPLEESILWLVLKQGLPTPPTPPRTRQAQDAFILHSFEDSAIVTDSGWRHAAFDPNSANDHFKPTYGVDFLSTIFEISGQAPQTPRVDFGGGHISNNMYYLATCQGQALVDILQSRLQGLLAQQQEDGSFRYSGKYRRAHWFDYASGDCANKAYALMEIWRLTGDARALAGAEKALAFINQLRTPQGAQVWELSLHTPDIMGASRCVLANVLAYQATNKQEYLVHARRWALLGLPFVYLWEDPELTPGVVFLWEDPELTPGVQPLMRYATIAVFGATGWSAPNWMGRPVQWCGLDYAHALILLSQYDATLPWGVIAEGIVASAECQQYNLEEEPYYTGLLPDSFQLDSQKRYGPYINASAIHQLRYMLDGRSTNITGVKVGENYVASPYPARAEGERVVIDAKPGAKYQIMINGRVLQTIESQGRDVVELRFPQ
ncbi:MAG: hypothetical protein Q4G03_10630 [Planctomycetia bacterium]|nr:hypothetical protein [Planctomycetia bacterium]